MNKKPTAKQLQRAYVEMANWNNSRLAFEARWACLGNCIGPNGSLLPEPMAFPADYALDKIKNSK
jgi:hypothetical protein